MDRHTVIVIIASVAIFAPFAYAALNIHALQALEIRSSDPGRFSFFEIGNGRPIEACNMSPFAAGFERLEITMFYQDDDKGTYVVGAGMLPPARSVLEGAFSSESYAESQYTFLHMDAQFGGTAPIRLDPSQMFVETSIRTSILGFIPYTINDRYAASEFYSMMNAELRC